VTSLPFFPLALAFCLLGACVIVQASMIVFLMRWYGTLRTPRPFPLLRSAWLLVRVAWWVVIAHLVQIAMWALAYIWIGALPEPMVAFYFSGVTYTTVGYGDVLLPDRWHLLAGIEGLTGILMAGWSTAILFAILHRLLLPAEHAHVPRPGVRP
jgi:hypothetical protein